MRKSIWIADDDPDDRMIIKEAFEENDYFETINFFEDGEKVLKKINEVKNKSFLDYPSLFILDLNMPRVNGLELLTIIKKNVNTKDIPVIILTTSKSNQDKDKVMKLGATDFITKPFSFNLLCKITKGLIEKYG